METTTATTFRGVATPRPMLPDEISANVVLERLQGISISDIIFHERSECSPEEINELLAQGFFPIELGDMSYKVRKFGLRRQTRVGSKKGSAAG